MNHRALLNFVLLVACVGVFAAARTLPPRDVTRPHYEFVPERQMSQDVAFDSFAPNPNFPDRFDVPFAPGGDDCPRSTPAPL